MEGLSFVCTISSCWDEPMARVPSTPEEFQKLFSKNKIVLMASSPPGQSLQRYFFYAQQVGKYSNYVLNLDFTTQVQRLNSSETETANRLSVSQIHLCLHDAFAHN